MKKFNIEVISKKPEKIDGILSHWGQITIGDFNERFVMPLDSWTLDQYQQQWQKGLERIKKYNTSCLVSSIANLNSKYPSIEIWVLYKERNSIFIQNCLLINETVGKLIKLSDFNPETCYLFINSRETITASGEKISEWSISIDDFYTSLENRS